MHGFADQLVMNNNDQNMKTLTEILHFDPYMNLHPTTLHMIFDGERQNDAVTENLLMIFSYDYSDDAKAFQEILLKGYIVGYTVSGCMLTCALFSMQETSCQRHITDKWKCLLFCAEKVAY